MEDPRKKWDTIYSSDNKSLPVRPTRVLEENAHLLPPGGDALEIACGLAGNAVLLAEKGFVTRAWDISTVVIAQVNAYAQKTGLPLTGEAHDVSRDHPAPASCDVIVIAHFLDRPLVPHLIAALRPGGLIFYQTFTLTKVSSSGPSNPSFLLADGELVRLFADLELLVYREERNAGDVSQGLRNEAMIVARKRPTPQ